MELWSERLVVNEKPIGHGGRIGVVVATFAMGQVAKKGISSFFDGYCAGTQHQPDHDSLGDWKDLPDPHQPEV